MRFSEWVTREYVQGLAERRNGGGLLEAADRFYDAQLLSEADVALRRAAEVFEDLGDRRGAATTKAALAILMEGRGNLSEAAALMTEALETFKSMGDPRASRAASDLLRILKKMGRSEGDSEAL